MNNDTRIDYERYDYDNRAAEPIEWVYMVYSNSNIMNDTFTDYEIAKKAYDATVKWMDEEKEVDKVELCKVDSYYLDFNDVDKTYRQSETIEHATLNLTENE